jgi:hypothetical protein
MNHTKGPWKVYDRHPEYKKSGLPKGIINPNMARFWVGAGESEWRGPSEIVPVGSENGVIGEYLDSEANAHLIAAAPELLEVLKWIVRLVEGPWTLKNEDGENPDLSDLKILIAKAEGKEK